MRRYVAAMLALLALVGCRGEREREEAAEPTAVQPEFMDVAGMARAQNFAVYEGVFDYNNHLYLITLDGERYAGLHRECRTPSFSPDGSTIMFSSFRDDDFEIYVMNADGSGRTRLTHNPAWDTEPVFSPDGKKIAFVSERDGHDEGYIMNADGSSRKRLTYGGRSTLLLARARGRRGARYVRAD